MSVRVAGPVLRLADTDFESLVRGEQGSPALSEALSVPGVPGALDAVRAPAAVAHVAVAGPTRLATHRAWVTRDTATLLLDVDGDMRQLMPMPPALLASGLARLLRLGPRRVGGRTARAVDAEVAADLFAEAEIVRRSAFDLVGADVAWNLCLSWPGGDRWLSGVDGREGLWLFGGSETAPRLEPTTSTYLWRRLTTLLPRVDKGLARGLDRH